VLVLPFRSGDSLPHSWDSTLFADSLAAALSRVQGLAAPLMNARRDIRSDFTLNGEVDLRDGRVVIATRLRRVGEDVDVWTSTYWRAEEPIGKLVSFLKVPVAEAVFRDLARRAATSSKEQR
jgi:TolB-like protein